MLQRPLLLLLGGSIFALPALGMPSLEGPRSFNQADASLLSQTYLTTLQPLKGESNGNLALNLGANLQGPKEDFLYGFEGDFFFGLRHNKYRYLNLAETYIGFAGPVNLSFGRKRATWSALDENWSLGLFQPRFRWDYLNEKQNGLLGLFADAARETWQATAYVSPLFLPEQGAPYDLNGGTCRNVSPWFVCPTTSLSLFNQPTAIRFVLDIPPVRKMVTRWGTGASFRLGRSEGPFARASFAYKPMNQLLLAYEGKLDLTSLSVPAIVHPRVVYHRVMGLDLGWQNARHSAVASVISENPKRDSTPANWNTQETYDALLWALQLQSAPFASSPATRAELGYFQRQGGNGADRGPYAQSSANVFEPRYAFRRAYSLGLSTPFLPAFTKNFLFRTRFVVDTAFTGNLLQGDFFYRPAGNVALNAGFDLLGSNSSAPVDFLSRYQKNDRFRAGVTYVF